MCSHVLTGTGSEDSHHWGHRRPPRQAVRTSAAAHQTIWRRCAELEGFRRQASLDVPMPWRGGRSPLSLLSRLTLSESLCLRVRLRCQSVIDMQHGRFRFDTSTVCLHNYNEFSYASRVPFRKARSRRCVGVTRSPSKLQGSAHQCPRNGACTRDAPGIEMAWTSRYSAIYIR